MAGRVLYLAAHGGFAGQAVPLGGGAAVANALERYFSDRPSLAFRVIHGEILGSGAPSARELVRYSAREYAKFCTAFRASATEAVLRESPRDATVLVNDISEGPDFEALHTAGFRVVTIYHVDVVAYIAAIYLRNRVTASTLARWWERLRPAARHVAPTILKLIFEQQRASLLYSHRVVVPSSGMRDVLLECYPETPPDRIVVLPWGAPPSQFADAEIDAASAELRRKHGIPADARVVLCLSRISPEKGQDLLLEALLEMERTGALPGQPLWLLICGEAAFMQGESHLAKLKRLASRLQRVRVEFPGYVTGLTKQAYLRTAEVYAFPSRHESYGLTMVEALAAGKPCLALDHHGAREVLAPEFAKVVPGGDAVPGLARALVEMLRDRDALRRMGEAARRWANEHSLEESLRRLENLLVIGHAATAARSSADATESSGSTRAAAPR